MKKKFAKILIELKSVNKENATLEAIFSTAKEDRHGDIVEQNWDLKEFKSNPVILNSHKYNDATEVVGVAEKVSIKDGKLEGKIKFAVNENPKAKIIFDLYAEGFLRAFSVGFMPLEFDNNNKILKSRLLEVSCVSVPANAEALAKMKAKGINVEDLDEDDFEKDEEEEEEKEGDPEEKKTFENLKQNKLFLTLEKKEYENWEDGPTHIRCKVRDIEQFEPGTLRKTKMIETFPEIEAIVGRLYGEKKESIQMLFFPKDQGWTLDDARKWLSRAQFEVLFGGKKDEKKEPAKPGGDIEVENEDSLNAGKSAKTRLFEAIKNENSKKLRALIRINEAIKVIGEISKVETHPEEDVKAENKRLINQAVRNLLKLKN
jgi:HK97 family phage prohead protease